MAAPNGRKEASLTAALASSNQLLDALQTQLRSQSVDIDHIESDIVEERAVVKNLRLDVARLQTVQRADAQDLAHLAGRLLATSQSTGRELDNTTKQIFRRRGWTAASRKPQGQDQ